MQLHASMNPLNGLHTKMKNTITKKPKIDRARECYIFIHPSQLIVWTDWLICRERKIWFAPCAKTQSLKNRREKWTVNGALRLIRSLWWSARTVGLQWFSQRDGQFSTSI